MKFHIISITICLSFLIGCTVTKQRYSNGYHVEWHKREQNLSSPKDKTPGDYLASSIAPMTYTNQVNNSTSQISQTSTELIFDSKKLKELEATSTIHVSPEKRRIEIKHKNEIQPTKKYLIQNKKLQQPPIGRLHMRSSEEYLKSSLVALLAGILFVGLYVLSVLVFEFAELSIGAIFFTFFGFLGALFLLMVPICLLMALLSYLIYG